MTDTPPRRAYVDLMPCIVCGATDHDASMTTIGLVRACPHVPTDRAVMFKTPDLRRFVVARIDNDPGDEDDGQCD